MIGLAIRFPAGRYHATPWGAHVNEAAVEWPPSPWRLLRALASAWHRTAPDLGPEEVRAVLGALAGPPGYGLPAAHPGHTRHYMPDRAHRREVQPAQSLVFDAFLHVDPGRPLTAVWDTDLPAAAAAALRRLAAGVTYVGRSESWCDVEVVEGEIDAADAVPLGGALPAPGEFEVVRLLAPAPPLDLAALEVGTADLQGGRSRRRDPPGARWLRYARTVAPAGAGRRGSAGRRREVVAHAVVWALEGVRGPAPLLTRVEEVVRAVREHLGLSRRAGAAPLRVLAFPSDLRASPPRLDRVALWAEDGLDERELERACRLGPLRVPKVGNPQAPLLLGHGEPGAMGGRGCRGLFGPGRRWRSVTPVLPWQLRGVDRTAPAPGPPGPAELIAASLPAGHGRPTIAVLPEGPVRWLEFRRGLAAGAVLDYPAPVTGPLIADSPHAGFGLFLCED